MNIVGIVGIAIIILCFISLFVFIFVDEAARRREYPEVYEWNAKRKKINKRNRKAARKMRRELNRKSAL